MKNIFTYPENAGTYFIDPNYLGDTESGLTKRMNELFAGDYKPWLGLDPLDYGKEIDFTMVNMSRFINYLDNKKSGNNLSMYDFWNTPIITALSEIAVNPSTVIYGDASIPGTLTTSAPHNLTSGDLIKITGLDGTWGNWIDPQINYYALPISATELEVSRNSALTDIIGFTPLQTITLTPSNPGSVSQAGVNFGYALNNNPVQVSIPAPFVPSNGSQFEILSMQHNGDSLVGNTYYLKAIPGYPEKYNLYKNQSLTVPVSLYDALPLSYQIDVVLAASVANEILTLNTNVELTEDQLVVYVASDDKLWWYELEAPYDTLSSPMTHWDSQDHNNVTGQTLYYLKRTPEALVYEAYTNYNRTTPVTVPWTSKHSQSHLFFYNSSNFNTSTGNSSVVIDLLQPEWRLGLGLLYRDFIFDGDAITPQDFGTGIYGWADNGGNLNGNQYYVKWKNPTVGNILELYTDAALTTPLTWQEVGLGDYVELRTISLNDLNYKMSGGRPTEPLIIAIQDNDYWGITAGEIYKELSYNPTMVTNLNGTLLTPGIVTGNQTTHISKNTNAIYFYSDDALLDTFNSGTVTQLYDVQIEKNGAGQFEGQQCVVTALNSVEGGERCFDIYKIGSTGVRWDDLALTIQNFPYRKAVGLFQAAPGNTDYPGVKLKYPTELPQDELRIITISNITHWNGTDPNPVIALPAGSILNLKFNSINPTDGWYHYDVYVGGAEGGVIAPLDYSQRLEIELMVANAGFVIAPLSLGEITFKRRTNVNDSIEWKPVSAGPGSVNWRNRIANSNKSSKIRPIFTGETVANVGQLITPSTTGVINYSLDNNAPYKITSVNWNLPGNKVYNYLDTAGNTQFGAKINPTRYWQRGFNAATIIANNETSATFSVSVDANGRFSGINIVDAGRYNLNTRMCLELDALPSTYTPVPLTPAQLADIWDTDDEWLSAGYSEAKTWPKNPSPANASIKYLMPNTINRSQNGQKYVKSGGYTKWVLEVEYPPMTVDQFQQFHAVAQAAQGQAIPFYFSLSNQAGNSILWRNFSGNNTIDNPLVRNDIEIADTTALFEGFAAFESNAFKRGEVLIADSQNGNGEFVTVINDVNANVFGEAKIRVAYPFHSASLAGEHVYKNPSHAVVTLANDGFEYKVDTAGFYYLTVTFDFDRWKN